MFLGTIIGSSLILLFSPDGQLEEEITDPSGDQGSYQNADLGGFQFVPTTEGQLGNEQRHRETNSGQPANCVDIPPRHACRELGKSKFYNQPCCQGYPKLFSDNKPGDNSQANTVE